MPLKTEPIVLNIGPQHPSTHGVFRIRVTFDGEIIKDLEPVFGYLHRGTEKLAEERNYVQIITLTDRLDYTAAMTNNQAYCLGVEKLLGVEVPERGQYLRVIAAELQRISSHLVATGFLLQDLGAFATPLMYCFRERERILDLFEMLCGARITVSYMRPGGVFDDAPEGPFSLNLLYDVAERAGRLYATIYDGRWFHVGTPEELRVAELEILESASEDGRNE